MIIELCNRFWVLFICLTTPAAAQRRAFPQRRTLPRTGTQHVSPKPRIPNSACYRRRLLFTTRDAGRTSSIWRRRRSTTSARGAGARASSWQPPRCCELLSGYDCVSICLFHSSNCFSADLVLVCTCHSLREQAVADRARRSLEEEERRWVFLRIDLYTESLLPL